MKKRGWSLALIFAAILILTVFVSCSQKHSDTSSVKIASKLDTIGCQNFIDELTDAIFDVLSNGDELPSTEKVLPLIENHFDKLSNVSSKAALRDRFLSAYKKLYEAIVKYKFEGVDPDTGRNFSGELAALLNGDDSTDRLKKWSTEFKPARSELEGVLTELKATCGASTSAPTPTSTHAENQSVADEPSDGESDSAPYLTPDEFKHRKDQSTLPDSQEVDAEGENNASDSNTPPKGDPTQPPQPAIKPPSTTTPGPGGQSTTKPDTSTNKAPVDFFTRLSQAVKARTLHPAVAGARLTMGTAYQTCRALEKPLMPFNEHIRGVTRGRAGWMIENIRALVMSHYYIRDSKSDVKSCYDNNKFPLIYDYGGKPGRSLSNGKPAMNLFINNITTNGAASHLGIDCAGFVSAAYLTAGLKLAKSNRCVPEETFYIYTRMLTSRSSPSAYNCLADVQPAYHKNSKGQPTYEWSLLPGDWVATEGHVIMIDKVGKNKFGVYDPFKIGSLTDPRQCNALNYKNFDFSVIQSSANASVYNGKTRLLDKGIGINRMAAAQYLYGDLKTRRAITDIARAACRRKFSLSADYYGPYRILRHKSQDPDCICKERVRLVQEQCMSSCPSSEKMVL